MGTHNPRLLDQVRDRIRRLHYSYRTEKTYVHWIRRFILFHGKRHPRDMDAAEVELPWMDNVVRAKRPNRVPVVLSRGEVSAIFARLREPFWLMASPSYGSGLRVCECRLL